jgi:glycosyltransferase involved in cell wall biosynthesis
MKILHVIPSLHGGGAEKFCIDLCNEMSKTHDVTICSLFDISENMFMAKAISSRVKVVTLNKKLGFDSSIFLKIFKLMRQEKYEIVNTHLRALIYSLLGIFFTKSKFFHTVHNMANKETSDINMKLHKAFFKFLDVRPIAISSMVLKSIKAEYGNEYNILIENGVKKPSVTEKYSEVQKEVMSLKHNKSTKVILTIGRISAQKNHKMLIKVVNRLILEGENIILLLIGDDYENGKPLLSELKTIASKGIYFLGMKENVADYLLCADVFCLPSLYEGLPITLLESLALGIPSICTPAGGIVDVINDGENGWVSENFSEEAFYQTIKKYLASDEVTKLRVSSNAKQSYVNKYSIALTSKNYINLYTDAFKSYRDIG